MFVERLGSHKVIMSNPGSRHDYFGWPTVARLQNGKIAAAASGYRLSHICPFGKAVITYSEDNGETYTIPAPVIDTVLDDRDAGITAYGESSVIITSFNNTLQFQREHSFTSAYIEDDESTALRAYSHAYLNLVRPEAEAASLGATYRISHDYGVTFGPLQFSPIMSPHGPTPLKDGNLLWVGRPFEDIPGVRYIHAYKMTPDGQMEKLGEIDDIYLDGERLLSCEPHAIELPDGRYLCHIRVQRQNPRIFTTYQSISEDGGKTWSAPERLLELRGGAPAHLLQLKNSLLLSVYGYRQAPYGLRFMVSADNGATWQTDQVLCEGFPTGDLGYPSTVELDDGSLLTVFYAREIQDGPALIMQQKWKLHI